MKEYEKVQVMYWKGLYVNLGRRGLAKSISMRAQELVMKGLDADAIVTLNVCLLFLLYNLTRGEEPVSDRPSVLLFVQFL